MQEEFATSLPACISSFELIHAETEEDKEEDLRVLNPPKFSNVAGKDDLDAFAHDLGAWYNSTRSVSTATQSLRYPWNVTPNSPTK